MAEALIGGNLYFNDPVTDWATYKTAVSVFLAANSITAPTTGSNATDRPRLALLACICIRALDIIRSLFSPDSPTEKLNDDFLALLPAALLQFSDQIVGSAEAGGSSIAWGRVWSTSSLLNLNSFLSTASTELACFRKCYVLRFSTKSALKACRKSFLEQKTSRSMICQSELWLINRSTMMFALHIALVRQVKLQTLLSKCTPESLSVTSNLRLQASGIAPASLIIVCIRENLYSLW